MNNDKKKGKIALGCFLSFYCYMDTMQVINYNETIKIRRLFALILPRRIGLPHILESYKCPCP